MIDRETLVNGLVSQHGATREAAERAADRTLGASARATLARDEPGYRESDLTSEQGYREYVKRGREIDRARLPEPVRRCIDADEAKLLEKEIEHACDKLVLACRGRVIKFSHPGRTKQTPGIADRLYTFPRHRRGLWFEVKSPDGKQRPDQQVFQEDVTAGGHEYLCGGLGDLRHWLFANAIVDGYDHENNPMLPRASE